MFACHSAACRPPTSGGTGGSGGGAAKSGGSRLAPGSTRTVDGGKVSRTKDGKGYKWLSKNGVSRGSAKNLEEAVRKVKAIHQYEDDRRPKKSFKP